MSNSNNEIAIKWSPHLDEDFILVAKSILFYRIMSFDGSAKNRIDHGIFISDNTDAKLIGSINCFPNQKIISWYPGEDPLNFHTLAVHESGSNQINVLSLSNQPDNPIINLTFEMENARKGNQIEWNPIKNSHLAVGFEKLENTSSICIWDASHSISNYQLDDFESCISLAWDPINSDVLYSTSSNQLISKFDLRAGLKPVLTINSEYINGFTVDSKNCYLAASYFNKKIAIWDVRKMEKSKDPFSLITEQKQIKKVQFCPSKADRLAVLSDGSSQVNVYRLEEKNDSLTKELIQYQKGYKNSAILNSFCWHSKDSNKLMATFSGTYNVLLDMIVADYCPIGISANETLNIAVNDKIATLDMNKLDNELDIGEKIKQRVIKNYGVQDFLLNVDLLSQDKSENDVKYLWEWLDLSNRIYETGNKLFEKFSGVKSVLQAPIQEFGHIDVTDFKKNYIQKLCGWFNWQEMVTKLEAQGEPERAACICVFNSGIDRAIEILRNASVKSSLNEYLALSLALSVIHRSPNFDAKESGKILNKLNNPYLKALFSYMLEPDCFEKNNQLYNDVNILLPDRICMAMTMLKQEQLAGYINRLTTDFIKQGNLYGILLTGLNNDCVDLFQYYIHRTSDVQTPAVAIIHSTFAKTLSSKLVNGWIESYRDLLDCWMLWEQRALYDIHRAKPAPEPKINVRCLLCGENFSSKRKTRIMKDANESANIGMTCQACSKPSLRCSVCSLYMTVDPSKSAFNGDKDKMTYWFLFCQKCTHGGHLGHLENWFKSNSECPVMNCTCQCYLRDDIIEEMN